MAITVSHNPIHAAVQAAGAAGQAMGAAEASRTRADAASRIASSEVSRFNSAVSSRTQQAGQQLNFAQGLLAQAAATQRQQAALNHQTETIKLQAGLERQKYEDYQSFQVDMLERRYELEGESKARDFRLRDEASQAQIQRQQQALESSKDTLSPEQYDFAKRELLSKQLGLSRSIPETPRNVYEEAVSQGRIKSVDGGIVTFDSAGNPKFHQGSVAAPPPSVADDKAFQDRFIRRDGSGREYYWHKGAWEMIEQAAPESASAPSLSFSDQMNIRKQAITELSGGASLEPPSEQAIRERMESIQGSWGGQQSPAAPQQSADMQRLEAAATPFQPGTQVEIGGYYKTPQGVTRGVYSPQHGKVMLEVVGG